ncbi:MAG: VanZ family protein [Saprospiraceae bacterium]|nr:VanZ family protein [Saprospiraceae bacterium]
MNSLIKNRQSLFKVLAWLWFIVLTVLLLLPGNDLPSIKLKWLKHVDKVIHFTSFFYLAAVFLLSTRKEDKSIRKTIFVSLLAYAIIMESIQHLVQKSRIFEKADMMANICGVFTAFAFYYIFRYFKESLTQKQ